MDLGRVIVVLVGHGSPPKGFPDEKVAEYVRLERRVKAGDRKAEEELEAIEEELMAWPRTAENDPYWASLLELAAELERVGGFMKVIPAFNDFCPPRVGEAIEQAIGLGPEVIIVVPTMMVKGGEHSERDIREAVESASRRHSDAKIIYAWPFDLKEQASFLVSHVARFAKNA